MKYQISTSSDFGKVCYANGSVEFVAKDRFDNAGFSVSFSFPEWEPDTYVFLPSCAYDGNRIRRVTRRYPPAYLPQELGPDPEPLISTVPALEPDGSGNIEVTSADCSVPCVGLFYPQKQQAFFVFCQQQCKDKNIGFHVERGQITVQYPAMRRAAYVHCRPYDMWEQLDSGVPVEKRETLSSVLVTKEYSCSSVTEFFEIFFGIRKCLLADERQPNQYTRALWELMESRYNDLNWSGRFYGHDRAKDAQTWYMGWSGGGMVTAALLKNGQPQTAQRAEKTIDYMTSHLTPNGFFAMTACDTHLLDDSFGKEYLKNAMLVRRQSDALYFLFKQFDLVSPKPQWVAAAKGVADVLADLYRRYESFGQFVNQETSEMIFGGTTSAASAIGALARAGQFFKDEGYLSVARQAAEQYYRRFVAKGLTYGAPSEAMCSPDSESCYAMLESMVVLYEVTKEEKWLSYAKDCAHLFSTWVVTYRFRFPQHTEFARLGINTVGSVFANVQNKHAAPGICTASGDALYKLYRYTGNRAYLELLQDIASFIPQCVSTPQRPIRTTGKRPDEYPPEKQVQSPGAINERVNMSDWEPTRVGGVFYGSCWCEASLLLTYSELIWNENVNLELS